MAGQLREFRRYAIVGLTGLAAVLTPPDPFSLLVGVALGVALYEAAILLAARLG
jgi:Sec-independent protein secretion pathway component TatC